MRHLTFESFRRDAPSLGEEWASTDRGWLYAAEKGCIGYYLSYPAMAGDRAASVLAHVYDRVLDPITGRSRTERHRSKDCANVADAQAWMLEETTGQIALR